MRVEKDFEELLKLFNQHGVKYCIIGAFAVAYHFKPRYTKDLDLFVEPSKENAKKIMTAIKNFGFGSVGLSEEDFSREHQIIQLGVEPVRIDIITSIGSCSFEEAWKTRKAGTYGNEKVHFIGLGELIKSKKAANRPHDIADIKNLEKVKKASR